MTDHDQRTGIGFLHKYEICKERMLTSFLNNYKRNENVQTTFEIGKKILRSSVASMQIKNRNQILGKGFQIDEKVKLNTYQRFDIHKENSIRSEELVLLRKK